MVSGRSPRLASFSYVGFFRYSLTFCTHRRIPAFTQRDVVLAVLSQIRLTADRFRFAVIAYCFMPDHLHLLVEGLSAASDLRAFADAAKQSSGYRYVRMYGRHLWQASYYDRVLRTDEHTIIVCRYIWRNPVRARLVESPADYPYSGSDAFPFPACLADPIRGCDSGT
jgi:REP element-mobilizing transposase RayT